MYVNDANLLIDNNLLDSMEVQGIMINPVDPETGILLLSEGMFPSSQNVVVHMYFLRKIKNEGYSIDFEVEAFSFASFDQASQFIHHLPQMSAIELLLMLNSPMNVSSIM